MTELDVFLPHILSRARGCSEPLAYQAIRDAAIEFCERTRLWRSCDSFTAPDDGEGFVVVPSGAVLHEIESARFEGHNLEPKSVSWLDDNVHDWRNHTASRANYITQLAPDTVKLVPGAPGSIELSLILKPSDEAEDLPDFMASQYRRVIAGGALGHILSFPGEPFTQPELAGFYATWFDQHLDKLFNQSIKGQQRAPTRTVPNYF